MSAGTQRRAPRADDQWVYARRALLLGSRGYSLHACLPRRTVPQMFTPMVHPHTVVTIRLDTLDAAPSALASWIPAGSWVERGRDVRRAHLRICEQSSVKPHLLSASQRARFVSSLAAVAANRFTACSVSTDYRTAISTSQSPPNQQRIPAACWRSCCTPLGHGWGAKLT